MLLGRDGSEGLDLSFVTREFYLGNGVGSLSRVLKLVSLSSQIYSFWKRSGTNR